jgi:hypothetical protein
MPINQPIKIDLSKIPNMKCYCGADVFNQVFNLKYISSILCGDPQGGTATVFMYQCALCKQMYAKSLPAAEVEKLYNALPPERKSFVDALKLQLEQEKAAIDFKNLPAAGGVPVGKPE